MMNMGILSAGSRGAPSVAAPPALPPPPPPRYYFSSPRCGPFPCPSQHAHKDSRRYLLGATSLAVAASLDIKPTTPEYPPKSPFIEQLLERSRANKAKNDQERLNSYYERNYKEYFEFLEGTIKNKTELTETEKGILKWLDKTRSKNKWCRMYKIPNSLCCSSCGIIPGSLAWSLSYSHEKFHVVKVHKYAARDCTPFHSYSFKWASYYAWHCTPANFILSNEHLTMLEIANVANMGIVVNTRQMVCDSAVSLLHSCCWKANPNVTYSFDQQPY